MTKTGERILIFCLTRIPKSIRPITAVSYLTKTNCKHQQNQQILKKRPIFLKPIEKVHQSLVFIILAVKFSMTTSF